MLRKVTKNSSINYLFNAPHPNNAGKAVFRPHSLIREKHSGQG
jgi:hypothetical protein